MSGARIGARSPILIGLALVVVGALAIAANAERDARALAEEIATLEQSTQELTQAAEQQPRRRAGFYSWADLLGGIEAAAEAAGVESYGYATTGATEPEHLPAIERPHYRSLGAEISGRASYERIVALAAALAHVEPALELTELEIERAPERPRFVLQVELLTASPLEAPSASDTALTVDEDTP